MLGSQFGTAHLVRLGVLAAAAFLLRPLLSGAAVARPTGRCWRPRRRRRSRTWPLSGHPAASPVPAVSVVVDAAHLAGMAVWLGGLVMLVGVPAPRRPTNGSWARSCRSGRAGRRSPWPALLLAGAVQALIEVGTSRALFDTTYGQLMIAKVVLFAVVIAVAAYSRRLVRARVAASRPCPLRRAIWAELGITAVVLALSASLVQTTPGAHRGRRTRPAPRRRRTTRR